MRGSGGVARARQITLRVEEISGGTTEALIPIREVLLAGYTGRDRGKVMEHIRELEHLGVAAPDRIPTIYVVGPELISTSDQLLASGPETSGEAELYAIPLANGEILVGIGSDHTDRAAEAIDVAASKGLCPKAISSAVWRFADVKEHWDSIWIRSWVVGNDGARLYQEGQLDAFLTLEDVLSEVRLGGHPDLGERVVFGGTLPVIGGFAYAQRFDAELHDPVLGRRLRCGYDVVLPTAGAPGDS